MPLLGALLSGLITQFVAFVGLLFGAKYAVRISAIIAIATIYLSCVVYYTTLIGPWIGTVFSTQFGALLGLLFPPISGSVVAGVMGYYTCVVGAKYVTTLLKLAAH
jgi:hypothetical protein